jgi:hypothetical protein
LKSLLVLAVVFLAVFSILPLKTHASPPTTVMMLDKANYPFVVGCELNVTVVVQNVSNLGMWWLQLGFDPNMLIYTGFCLPQDNVFAGQPVQVTGPWVENESVRAVVGLVYEPNASKFSGSGKLITLSFIGVNAGVTSLNITNRGDFTAMNEALGIFPTGADIPFDVVNSTVHSVSRPLGDVNGDTVVDMKDVSLAVAAFNSYIGSAQWNYYADVDGDGRVDMRDIVIIVLNFGAKA